VNQELNQLVHQAKQGNKQAFEQLMTQYKGKVFRHAYAMLGDRMEAEDVSQEAFIKVYYSLHKLDSEYAFVSWLTRIVSNLCYDRIQKKKKKHIIIEDGLDETLAESPDSEGSLQNKQLQLTIEEAMQTLSSEHREVIVLREIQGFTYDEMADILQIPKGTVKSRIHTARLELQKQLKG